MPSWFDSCGASLFCRLAETSPVVLEGMLERLLPGLDGLGLGGDLQVQHFDWWGDWVIRRRRRGGALGLVDVIENLPEGESVLVSSVRKGPDRGDPDEVVWRVYLMETGRGAQLGVSVQCDVGASDEAIADCLLAVGEDLKEFGLVSGLGAFIAPRSMGSGPTWGEMAFRAWAIWEAGPGGGLVWRRLDGLRADTVAVFEPADRFMAPGSYRVLPVSYRQLLEGAQGATGLGCGSGLVFRLFDDDESVLARVVEAGVEALRGYVGGGGVSWRVESASAGVIVGSGAGWVSAAGFGLGGVRVEGAGPESALGWVAQAFRAGSYWDVELSAECGRKTSSGYTLQNCLLGLGAEVLASGRLGAGLAVFTEPWSLLLTGDGGDWTARSPQGWATLQPFTVDRNGAMRPGPLWQAWSAFGARTFGIYLPGRDDPAAGRFCGLHTVTPFIHHDLEGNIILPPGSGRES